MNIYFITREKVLYKMYAICIAIRTKVRRLVGRLQHSQEATALFETLLQTHN